MGSLIQLTSGDGFVLPAYQSLPSTKSKGGVVIIQEIFGLTEQLCELADQYAECGYSVIVPALFARISENTRFDFSQAEDGLAAVARCTESNVLLDIQAALDATHQTKVNVIGYCWGGGIAYLAASRLNLNSGVAYYGTRLLSYSNDKPKCRFQFHFGELDSHTPSDLILKMKGIAHQAEFHAYPNADHAFANHHRPSFNQQASDAAFDKVLTLMAD